MSVNQQQQIRPVAIVAGASGGIADATARALQQVNIMRRKDQSWVLVTGASSGFGEEFARQYAAQGRPLVLVARRLERLQTLATELRERYRVDVIVEQVDLSAITAVVELRERLRERGITIDVLVNNAGSGLQGPFLDEPLDRTMAHADVEADDDAAGARGARRDPCAASRTSQCRAGVGQQGVHALDQGRALAEPRHHFPSHGCRN